MKLRTVKLLPLLIAGLCSLGAHRYLDGAQDANTTAWGKTQANAWYSKQPWLVGSNYTPANAINELEMWQADTFDPKRIDLELGWAQKLGMNTMRVFLHDLLWSQDPVMCLKSISVQ